MAMLIRSGKRNGFTLIELLVVMAIIAIVAVLSLPALERMYQGATAWSAMGTLRGVFTQARADAVSWNTYSFVVFVRPRWPWLERNDQIVAFIVRLVQDENGNPKKAVLVDRGTILPPDMKLVAEAIKANGTKKSLPSIVDYKRSVATTVAQSKLVFTGGVLHDDLPGYLLVGLNPPEDWDLPQSWDPKADGFEAHYVCLVRYNDLCTDGVREWQTIEGDKIKDPSDSILVSQEWVNAVMKGGTVASFFVCFGPDGTMHYGGRGSVLVMRFITLFRGANLDNAKDVNFIGIWPLTGEIGVLRVLRD